MRKPHVGDVIGAQVRLGRTAGALDEDEIGFGPQVLEALDGQAKEHKLPREQVIREVLLAQQPNKKFATVEELGALTVFLTAKAKHPNAGRLFANFLLSREGNAAAFQSAIYDTTHFPKQYESRFSFLAL